MMTRARKDIINLNTTRHYHIMVQCVRGMYLCGNNPLTGKDCQHRRDWIIERLKFLGSRFAIDICAYAILHNHYHLVLHVNLEKANAWSEHEVVERWCGISNTKNTLVNNYINGIGSEAENQVAQDLVALWRSRLSSISWFMSKQNEFIAHKANKEEKCTGDFWKTRFKSQALLDDLALLSCMVYVDLNPVRAGIAANLYNSDFTSIQERIKALEAATNITSMTTTEFVEPISDQTNRAITEKDGQLTSAIEQTDHLTNYQPQALLPFSISQKPNCIHYSLIDYLALVDWSGRLVRPDKRGFINDKQPKIIESLCSDTEQWLRMAQYFERQFADFAGTPETLTNYCKQHNRKRCRGIKDVPIEL